MDKKGSSETTRKVPKTRKGIDKAKKAPTKIKKPTATTPVEDGLKGTEAKVAQVLADGIEFSETLSTKSGLKFIISKYLKTFISTERLEETIFLILENLRTKTDRNGRTLDSLYWFREGCSVEIKDGKLYAKDPEGKALISGVKIKGRKPQQNAQEQAEPEATSEETTAEPAPATTESTTNNEEAPEQEIDLCEIEAEADSANAVAVAVAEQPSVPVEPSALSDIELLTLLTSTEASFQGLREEFSAYTYDRKPFDTTNLEDLQQQVKNLADDLAKLPTSQFQLAKVRMLRMKIGVLQTEIIQFTTRFIERADKKVVEMPSLITGLDTKVKTFAENAATWISEVELITNTSRIPTEAEVQGALGKHSQLLAESDDLRKTISTIETSPTLDTASKQRIDSLREQIAKTSVDIEEPVRKLQTFLTNHRKPLSAPPPPPSARPNGNNVVNLRTVTTSDRRLPVNADDVLRENSWKGRLSDWLKNLTR